MKGVISSYRRGVSNQKTNQMIIMPEGVNTLEDASKLVGKEVKWVSPAKKEIKGKITSAHGSKGAVRALFETGMPGQSVSQKVDIQS